jgi:hypothetical protein
VTGDIHVRIRRLIVPAAIGGDRDALAREVVESIAQCLSRDARTSREALEDRPRPIATRVGEAVAESVRVVSSRSNR